MESVMYCVYLTIYFGKLLPKRYIGSCKTENMKYGYNGSVSSKKYKDVFTIERYENPHLFKTRILSLHETDYDARCEELRIQRKYDVVKSENYINEAFAIPNGYFGRNVAGENNPMHGKNRKGEKHKGGKNISKALKNMYQSDKGRQIKQKKSINMRGENNPMYGKTHSEETKRRMSQSRSGENNHMYGKTHSEETRKKISETRKSKKIPSPFKGKKLSEETKQKLRKPRKEETKQKLRNTYLVNDTIYVYNAKQYCEDNGFNYVNFTQAAKNCKPYKGLHIIKIREATDRPLNSLLLANNCQTEKFSVYESSRVGRDA